MKMPFPIKEIMCLSWHSIAMRHPLSPHWYPQKQFCTVTVLCFLTTSPILAGNRPHPSKTTPTYFVEGDPRIHFCLPTVDPRIHFALVCGAKVSLLH